MIEFREIFTLQAKKKKKGRQVGLSLPCTYMEWPATATDFLLSEPVLGPWGI